MVAYTEIKHNSSQLVNMPYCQKTAFLYRSQVKYILLNLNHIQMMTVFKNTNTFPYTLSLRGFDISIEKMSF